MAELEHDFEVDKEIDAENLPGEILGIANLVGVYSAAVDEADEEVMQSQLNCDIVAAELFMDIKKNAKKYDLDKPSDNVAKNAIRTTKKWKEAEKERIEAINDFNAAKTALKAIYTKRNALDQLLSGAKMNWFATPDDVDDLGDYKERQAADRRKAIHFRQKEKMKDIKSRKRGK